LDHGDLGVDCVQHMATTDDDRRRQIAAGAGILLAITAIVCGGLIGWRHLPGLLGEWLGLMIGIVTTPFILELSFAVLGLTVVLALNHWRQKRTGDELMYLEQVDEPGNLPEHASWAVFRDPPLTGEEPSLLVQADGALEIGDYQTAAECLAALPEDELKLHEALSLRLKLARATGRADLAEKLDAQFRGTTDQNI
jgi:hypothetical protein